MSLIVKKKIDPFTLPLSWNQRIQPSHSSTMAVEVQQSRGPSIVEKTSKVEIEDATSDSEKGAGQQRQGDYAGAVAKSNPAEIALVKKMDWRIMPTLWCMYFL